MPSNARGWALWLVIAGVPTGISLILQGEASDVFKWLYIAALVCSGVFLLYSFLIQPRLQDLRVRWPVYRHRPDPNQWLIDMAEAQKTVVPQFIHFSKPRMTFPQQIHEEWFIDLEITYMNTSVWELEIGQVTGSAVYHDILPRQIDDKNDGINKLQAGNDAILSLRQHLPKAVKDYLDSESTRRGESKFKLNGVKMPVRVKGQAEWQYVSLRGISFNIPA